MEQVKVKKAGKKAQRGAMSLEMLMVLALVLVLFGVFLSRGKMMQSRAGTLQESGNDITLIQNVKGLLRSGSGYGTSGTDLVPALITAEGVPGDMTVSGSTIKNTVGGAVTIVSTGAGFTVTTNGLAADVCMQAAQKVTAVDPTLSTKLNGGSAIAGAVTSAAAAAGCNVAGSANVVAFTAAS